MHRCPNPQCQDNWHSTYVRTNSWFPEMRQLLWSADGLGYIFGWSLARSATRIESSQVGMMGYRDSLKNEIREVRCSFSEGVFL